MKKNPDNKPKNTPKDKSCTNSQGNIMYSGRGTSTAQHLSDHTIHSTRRREHTVTTGA